MSELRWHPLLREWVGVAGLRQDRPQMPKDWCPFCPGSGKVPDHYDTYLYPNDFAALSKDSAPFVDKPAGEPGILYSTGAQGVCDVVIYHSDHNLTPSQMSAGHWRKVVDLWTERSVHLFADPGLQQVYIFENTGVAIGVTMPHPHGQIYTFPFIPPLLEREFASSKDYFEQSKECLYCSILNAELQQKIRIVLETDNFVAFVPFHARWPGEMQIYPRRHFGALVDMNDGEKTELAGLIKVLRLKYDNLWGFAIPLMMIVRQRPSHGDHSYFHFHVEFYPIQRSATKLKYLAGVESGAGTFLNDTVAETKAAEFAKTEPCSL